MTEDHLPVESLVGEVCYNPTLDDEIRSRLDKLNALSDLINSLERQFDEANSIFRETLKCSTDRLSSIAKTLGTKSIRRGRAYNAAKISVEQSQTDCQKACVQFEQANEDHQIAKKAIKEAELKLREIKAEENQGVKNPTNGVIQEPRVGVESIDISKLKLEDELSEPSPSTSCDITDSSSSQEQLNEDVLNEPNSTLPVNSVDNIKKADEQTIVGQDRWDHIKPSFSTTIIENATKFSEELNQANKKLIEAEKKRGQSERQHLDRANKLMLAQENLMKLEREFGPSIRRSQLYFDESKRFNAKLNSVKGVICRISEEILAAKRAYAQTLSELEQFSEDLHEGHTQF